MTAPSAANFKRRSQTHLKHIWLKGQRPTTIEAQARAIRRMVSIAAIASKISPRNN